MSKKYFLFPIFIFVFSLLFTQHSFAYIKVTGRSSADCTISQTVTGEAVSDFVQKASDIKLCVKSDIGGAIDVKDPVTKYLYKTINTIAGVLKEESPNADITWDGTQIGIVQPKKFQACDSNGCTIDYANYKMTLSYAPITLKILNTTTGAMVPNGGTVSVGDKVEVSCTNGTELYVDSANNGGNARDEDKTGAKNYALSYSMTDVGPAGTSHVAACRNIGGKTEGDTYFPNSSFTVKADKEYFDITSIDVNPKVADKPLTFTWTSDSDTCNLYNYDKSTKLGTGTKSGTNWSATASAVAGSDFLYGYYVKCYSATKYPSSNLEADTDQHIGWKKYEVSILKPIPEPCTSPVGSVRNAYGECACISPMVNENGVCTNPGPTPTSQFNVFNVSAGYVKKGTSINLSWNIQSPNPSCKIVAESIKGKKLLFDTSNVNFIQHSLHNSLISAPEGKKISVGDYYTAMNKNYLTMNESTRFTASCLDTKSSKLYKVVRDVYVTNEAQR